MAEATSGWDIAGTIADGVAGIGTLGALVVAIVVFRRQVDDSRVDQAARVFVSVSSVVGQNPPSEPLMVDNNSSLPIFKIIVAVTSTERATTTISRYHFFERLAAHEHIVISDYPMPTSISTTAILCFQDAAGRYWIRDTAGTLKPDDGSSVRKWEDQAKVAADQAEAAAERAKAEAAQERAQSEQTRGGSRQ